MYSLHIHTAYVTYQVTYGRGAVDEARLGRYEEERTARPADILCCPPIMYHVPRGFLLAACGREANPPSPVMSHARVHARIFLNVFFDEVGRTRRARTSASRSRVLMIIHKS